MLNEDIQAQYPAADDFDATTNSHANESSANGEENEDDYGDEDAEQELEFTKTKRENVFE